MLAIALGGLAASRDRWWLSGVAIGVGILARPHIALVAATVGVGVAIARRDWRPLVRVGLGSSLGLWTLLAHNRVLFGEWALTAGHGEAITARATSTELGAWAATIADGLVSPRYGLLVYAPFLLVLVVPLVARRVRAPDWAIAQAVGGALYLLVQWKANRASGGLGFFPYRYPLEALTAAAPLLGLAGIVVWRARSRLASLALVITVSLAVMAQAIGALGNWSPPTTSQRVDGAPTD